MFGYIRPFQPNLRVCEWEAYRSAYCGLCQSLGRTYGRRFRLTLSYDCTLIALLAAAFEPNPMAAERKKCTCNPLKKCYFLCGAESALAYAATVSVLLTGHKLLDDCADERFFRKIGARLLFGFFRRGFHKAEQKAPELASCFRAAMQQQKRLEETADVGLDACAEPTGKMLALALEKTGKEPIHQRVLHEIGYQLGRWVYLADASDDLEKDIRNGSFNPLKIKFALTKDATKQQISAAREYANGVLNMDAAQMASDWALLNHQGRYAAVLNNIFTEGLASAQKRILKQEKKAGKSAINIG